MNSAPKTIAVSGATGFIGRHLLQSLMQRPCTEILALSRRPPEASLAAVKQIRWIQGNLDAAETQAALLLPGSTFVHLAYPDQWTRDAHLDATRLLAETAANRRVSRVILCSTATVVGRTSDSPVTAETRESPQAGYEEIKLSIEKLWLNLAANKFDLVIARPSAVFGPGGRNLLKLTNALLHGNTWVNYLRSCLYAGRQMNLVAVENVVAALEFLIAHDQPFGGKIFYIADDDDPLNRFCDVERILSRELGLGYYRLPPLGLPQFMLSTLLRASGASNINPGRMYDCTALRQLGWRKVRSLEDGLRSFAAWVTRHPRSL